MKISVILLSFLGTAHGGVSNLPSVSINIQDGSTPNLEGLDPLLSYSTSTSALGCDVEVGTTASIKPTADILSLPRSIWGKISGDVAGWGLSSRVSASDNFETTTIDLAASNDDLDASIKIGSLNKIQLEKGFDTLGGRVAITPRYNINTSATDVTVSYDSKDTSVTVDASKSAQKLTISQQVADGHTLTPSITSSGETSLAWKKNLGGGDSVTTTVTPGESVNVKWEDGDWVAQFKSDLDGFTTGGLTVSVNRKVTFL